MESGTGRAGERDLERMRKRMRFVHDREAWGYRILRGAMKLFQAVLQVYLACRCHAGVHVPWGAINLACDSGDITTPRATTPHPNKG